MLYLYEPLQVQDAQGNTITVYPDSHKPNVFYPIPNIPRFRRDEEGKPVFRLIKFRGGDGSSAPRVPIKSESEGGNDVLPADAVPMLGDQEAGGFLFFDVEFSLDEESTEAVRMELDEIVRAKYLSEGREIPDGFQIVLQQPRWTDGTVELLMEDTNKGLFESVSKTGKPSLMGNNVSSIAAALQPWQATLMEEAFKAAGGFSPLQVSYNLKFLAKLPPVRINIYASALDQYTMYKQYGKHPNRGACSNRDKVVRAITERAHSRDVVRIQIDSGGLTLDDETFKQLREFAMGLLQQWIQQEFLKAPPERATKEQIQQFTLKRLSETDFRNLNINIEQSATVEIPINPQGTLETLLEEGDDLSEEGYIVEVDLDADEFYQKRLASLKVYADFPVADAQPTRSDLLFVEVVVRYGDNEKTHTWDAQGSANTTANGGRWGVEWNKIPDVSEIKWEAKAVFRDIAGTENRSYEWSGATDSTEINIPVVLPGRAYLELREEGIPWNIIQYVHGKVEYIDNEADPTHLEKELILDSESDAVFVDEVIWKERSKPFQVTLAYHYKNGTVDEKKATVKGDLFVVESPIERWLTIPVMAKYVNEEWKEDLVRYEYRDQENDYIYEGDIHLSEEAGWTQNIVIPLINKDRDRYRYQWTRRVKSGAICSSKDYTGAPADGWLDGQGSKITYTGHVECESGDMLRVHVDPIIFLAYEGAGELIRAKVSLSRVGSNDIDQHSFKSDDDAWTWKEFVEDPEDKRYQWWAVYTTVKPFKRIQYGSQGNPIDSSEEIIELLPPQN